MNARYELEMSERFLFQNADLIRRQNRLVARLRRRGADMTIAQRLLVLLREAEARLQDHRALISRFDLPKTVAAQGKRPGEISDRLGAAS